MRYGLPVGLISSTIIMVALYGSGSTGDPPAIAKHTATASDKTPFAPHPTRRPKGSIVSALPDPSKPTANSFALNSFRASREAVHLFPTSDEQWQAEPVDDSFVLAHEAALWQQVNALTNVAAADIQCRSRSCKVDLTLRPGTTLDNFSASLRGFSPYRHTDRGWTFFFNPDLVEEEVMTETAQSN